MFTIDLVLLGLSPENKIKPGSQTLPPTTLQAYYTKLLFHGIAVDDFWSRNAGRGGWKQALSYIELGQKCQVLKPAWKGAKGP